MQIYAIRMFNFVRFGEKNNSIVFDLNQEQKHALKNGEITLDKLYDKVVKNPIEHIKSVKSNGIEGLLGIVGKIDGNPESSNGAGKSSILEAVCYAHYGKIVRLSANTDGAGDAGSLIITQVNGEIPKDITESWVEEVFESNGKVYRVKRGRIISKNRKTTSPLLEFEEITEHSSISESGHRTEDTKRSIDDVNDMPYELFVNSQMFGQNDAGKFLYGTDKMRKEMLMSLLDMNSLISFCIKTVRDEKSKTERHSIEIKETIRVLEEQLIDSYNKNISNDKTIFNESLYNNFMLVSNQNIEESQIELSNIEKENKGIDDLVLQLSNSDVIKKRNQIIEDGKREKDNLKSKTEQRDKQKEIWSGIYSDAAKNIEKKQNEKSAIERKISALQSQITQNKKFVDDFDKKNHDEKMSLIQKAKEARPKHESRKDELAKEIMEIEKSVSAIETKIQASNHIALKLTCQLNKIGADGKIECLECKSLVSKEHFDNKIEEEKKTQETLLKEVSLLKEAKETKAGKLKLVSESIKKIFAYIENEAATMAEFSLYQNKINSVSSDEKTIKENQETINIIVADISSFAAKKQEANTKTEEIDASFKKEIEEITNKIALLKEQYANVDSDAKNVIEKIEEKKRLKKDWESKRDKLNEKIGSIKKELEQFKNNYSSLVSKKKEMDDIVKVLCRYEKLEEIFGLDGIQTRIIKRYLPLLNVYVKEFLDILADNTINVTFIINSKSEVDINISGGTASVYKMMSGGEKMIIRLATDIGLALLKFIRSSKKPEIIALDEIFGPLDASKTTAVFKMLHALQDKFNRVILITHNSDIKEMIPNNILVEKSGGLYGLSEIKYIG